MNFQFTLRRLFGLVFVVAVICSLFASLSLMSAMVALAAMNGIACLVLLFTWRDRTSGLAGWTAILLFATGMFTDWDGPGQTPSGLHIAWGWLTAACIAQLATIVCWFLSVPPPPMTRQ
jgi:hypothetical protein